MLYRQDSRTDRQENMLPVCGLHTYTDPKPDSSPCSCKQQLIFCFPKPLEESSLLVWANCFPNPRCSHKFPNQSNTPSPSLKDCVQGKSKAKPTGVFT